MTKTDKADYERLDKKDIQEIAEILKIMLQLPNDHRQIAYGVIMGLQAAVDIETQTQPA